MATESKTYHNVARRWWLVALLAVLGALAGYACFRLTDPTYVAKAYIVVVARDAGNNAAAVSYAQAFSRIVPQGDVVNAAASASPGISSPDELRRRVRATASPDAPVIELAASAGSAQRAADLANLMAAGLVSMATKHSADTRINVILLSAADPPAGPASPRRFVDVAVGAAVGVLLGGLGVLAGEGRGRSRRAEPVATEPAELTGSSPMPDVTGRAPIAAGAHRKPYQQGRLNRRAGVA